MDINDFFDQFHTKIQSLADKYMDEEIDLPDLDQELQVTQQQSTAILEEWIQLEEALSQFDHLLTEGIQLANHPDWKRGKALYDLLLFEEAVPILESLVKQEPEWEKARLYLAHAYLASNASRKAKYELQFLFKTARNKEIGQLAAHALACIEGSGGSYEQALHFFEKINVDEVRPQWQTLFMYNHCQTLFQMGEYEACREKLIQCYQLDPYDWKPLFLLGLVENEIGVEAAGFSYWFEALQRHEHPHLLRAMAKHFERRSYYQMAAQCYERILKQEEHCRDEHVWFGLAWNYGMAGQKERSKSVYMKALTLFPKAVDIQISYVWMLLLWQETEQAGGAIERLRTLHPDHSLVWGLQFVQNGEYERAHHYLEQHG